LISEAQALFHRSLTKARTRRANATSVPVSVTASQIIYKYNPLNLVVSYALALSFASFSAGLGFYAFRTNGVTHTTAFSSVVATTRNPTLARFFSNHPLGTTALDERLAATRLRLGVIRRGDEDVHVDGDGNRDEERKEGDGDAVDGRVAFGTEGEVEELRTGGVSSR
jgi:hypothetical protein